MHFREFKSTGPRTTDDGTTTGSPLTAAGTPNHSQQKNAHASGYCWKTATTVWGIFADQDMLRHRDLHD
jgi:hypothetical protein